MFGRRSTNQPIAANQPRVLVHAIPSEFYAGADPVVTFTVVPKKINWSESTDTRATTIASKKNGSGAVIWLADRKHLAISGGALLIIFIIGAGGYYWWQGRPVDIPQPAPALEPVVPAPSEAVPPPEPAPASESEITNTSSAPTPDESSAVEKIIFPSVVLGDSSDADQDGLTDPEEELFKTDPAMPDTDSDKYADAHEVYNLYNPSGKEPEKLSDSGTVTEFVNPSFGYRLFYPKSWALGTADQENRSVLFSTFTGEFIEARAIEKRPGQNFNDWFAEVAPAERITDFIPFASAFKQDGWRRTDYIVYFFETPERVIVLNYHPSSGSSLINYRTVIKMMARSFQIGPSIEPLTPRIIEEPPFLDNSALPATATTGAVLAQTTSTKPGL